MYPVGGGAGAQLWAAACGPRLSTKQFFNLVVYAQGLHNFPTALRR
jgi:hypothetical protein